MKKLIGVLLLVFILALAGCGSSDTNASGNAKNNGNNSSDNDKKEDSKLIKVGMGLNEGHPQYDGLERFKEIVEEETDGDLKVEIYTNSQLGDETEMIESVQNGSLEVTIPATATLANFVPEFNIYNFPFLITEEEIADAVFESDVAQDLLKKLEDSNFIGFNYWEEGHYNITNNKKPIESADDLEGLKFRTMESDILLDSYKALGANPTPMAFDEVYVALQQGTIDGQTNPYSLIYDQKFHEVQEYISSTRDYYGVWVILMNKDFFEDLTSEQQEIVREAAIEGGNYEIERSRETAEEFKENIIADGIEFNDVDPEVREEMSEKIQPVLDEYAKDYDQDILEAFYDVIEEAKQ